MRACILAEGGCQRALRLIRAVAASGEAGPVGGVAAVGLRVGGGFGFGRVVPSPYAVLAVAEPWAAAIPAEAAEAAAGVFTGRASLVPTGHGVVTVAVMVTGVEVSSVANSPV